MVSRICSAAGEGTGSLATMWWSSSRSELQAVQHLELEGLSQLQETTTFVARFAGNYQVVNLLQKTP